MWGPRPSGVSMWRSLRQCDPTSQSTFEDRRGAVRCLGSQLLNSALSPQALTTASGQPMICRGRLPPTQPWRRQKTETDLTHGSRYRHATGPGRPHLCRVPHRCRTQHQRDPPIPQATPDPPNLPSAQPSSHIHQLTDAEESATRASSPLTASGPPATTPKQDGCTTIHSSSGRIVQSSGILHSRTTASF